MFKSRVDRIGLAVCLALLGDLALFAVLPIHYQDVGVTLANVGIILSIHRLFRIPLNPFIGLLVDRWGRRRPFLIGLFFAVVSTIGYGLASGLIWILFMRIVWGIAWMLINVSAMSMVVDLSTSSNRGSNSGRFTGWYMAGLALGPILGGFLVDGIGFRFAMILCGFITLAGAIIALFTVHETSQDTREILKNHPGTENPRIIFSFSGIGQKLWRLFLLFAIIQFAGEGVALSTLALKLQQTLGNNLQIGTILIGIASAGGVLLGIRSIMSAFASPIFGRIFDGKTNRNAVMLTCVVIGIAGFLMIAYFDSLAAILAGTALVAVSLGGLPGILLALLGNEVKEDQRGLVTGLYSTFGDIGSMLGPLMAYFLLERTGLQFVYLLCAILFGLSILIGALPVPIATREKMAK